MSECSHRSKVTVRVRIWAGRAARNSGSARKLRVTASRSSPSQDLYLRISCASEPFHPLPVDTGSTECYHQMVARTITLRLTDQAYEAVKRYAATDNQSMNAWIEGVLDIEDMRRRC